MYTGDILKLYLGKTVFCGLYRRDKYSIRSSGTSAVPVNTSLLPPNPVSWSNPVNRLKKVVLPVKGRPTSPICNAPHLLPFVNLIIAFYSTFSNKKTALPFFIVASRYWPLIKQN
jgi:hypothetical protein